VSYLSALEIVLGHEGGESDHPDDRGGHTNQGITQSTYNRWRDKHGQARQSVEHITREELVEIYFEQYWKPIRGDELPPAVAVAVFDCAINSGIGRTITLLQAALHVKQDGIFGPMTMNAVLSSKPRKLLFDFGNERTRFLCNIAQADHTQIAFIEGWVMRPRFIEQKVLLNTNSA
jgi:lysozyme family protein